MLKTLRLDKTRYSRNVLQNHIRDFQRLYMLHAFETEKIFFNIELIILIPMTLTHVFKQSFSNDKWNQWFAGITDGDGCFYISKKENDVSYEISTHVTDVRVLYSIKNQLKAGSIRLRSGSKSVRFRVKQKKVILDIVQRLNGKLRNPIRSSQLQQVCQLYNILYIPSANFISKHDAYLSGLIDSDGSLSISVSHSSAFDSQISGVEGRIVRLSHAKGFNQISVKVTSSHKSYLDMIQQSYGWGKVFLEKRNSKNKNPNHKYHWIIRSKLEFEELYEYTKKYPLKSVKMHQMRLTLFYFKYKSLNYHLQPKGTLEAKIWTKFAKSWYKYSY